MSTFASAHRVRVRRHVDRAPPGHVTPQRVPPVQIHKFVLIVTGTSLLKAAEILNLGSAWGKNLRPTPISLQGQGSVDVIFSHANHTTDVTEKFFVRVGVTEELPFVVTRLPPYYDR